MSFPFALVAIDLDGTLLAPDKSVSAENRAALARLQALGVQIVLASGRPHQNVLGYHRSLGLRGPIVSGNGGVVRVAETGEVWRERLLERALTDEILVEGRRIGVTQVWDGPEGVFALKETDWSAVLEERTASRVAQKAPPADGSPYKIFWIDHEQRIAAHEATYRARWGERSYVIVTDPEYLEFCPPGVDKATGLSVVCERLNIARERVLALGDGDNDAEMLAWAGCGIAMAHSRKKALAAADRVAPDGPPESAVARALSQLEQR